MIRRAGNILLVIAVVACTRENQPVRSVPAPAPADAACAPDAAPPDAARGPEAACAGGDQPACFALLDEEGEHADGLATMQRLCDGGALTACAVLGWSHLQGDRAARDAPRGRRLCDQACAGANAAGCSCLGWVAAHGADGAADPARALAYYRQACELGEMAGCEVAGRQLGDGDGVPVDLRLSEELLARACASGREESCRMLGNAVRLLGAGEAADPDMAAAVHGWSLLCERGDGDSCAEAGWRDESFPLGADAARVRALYDRGCALFSGTACYHQARLAAVGDPRAALPLFEHACREHEPRACAEASQALRAAQPVERARLDAMLEEACRLGDEAACTSACDGGDAEGCAELARRLELHAQTKAAAKAWRRTRELHKAACDAHDAGACDALASLYAYGDGVAVDKPRADALWEQACKGGHGDSCYALAEEHHKDEGGHFDDAGVALLEKACEAGAPSACASLARVVAEGGDAARARELYGRSCTDDDAGSCAVAGAALLAAGDRERAVVAYRRSCLHGSSASCTRLGELGFEQRPDPQFSRVTRY